MVCFAFLYAGALDSVVQIFIYFWISLDVTMVFCQSKMSDVRWW